MDVFSVIDKLKKTKKDKIDIRLYFTRKVSNSRYESYSPSISESLQGKLQKLVINTLEDVKGSEQREFNPIGSIEECVETYSTNEVESYIEIINSMEEDTVIRREISSSEISKLTFYCIKINIDEEEILIFRRVTKFNRLAKGVIGQFFKNEFIQLQNDLLGLDSRVDIIVYKGEMLILNHISLERIFSIHDQYRNKASQTLDLVERTNKISNFEQFREDCLSDKRVTRALTKLLNEEQKVENCFENFSNVIRVIDIFELEIELSENNTILLYEDRSQLMDMTRLIRDSYYKTFITETPGIDEGV